VSLASSWSQGTAAFGFHPSLHHLALRDGDVAEQEGSAGVCVWCGIGHKGGDGEEGWKARREDRKGRRRAERWQTRVPQREGRNQKRGWKRCGACVVCTCVRCKEVGEEGEGEGGRGGRGREGDAGAGELLASFVWSDHRNRCGIGFIAFTFTYLLSVFFLLLLVLLLSFSHHTRRRLALDRT